MKAKPKKKSKDKPPPSSPIPPELKKLVPDHPDISFRDVISNAEDTMALQVPMIAMTISSSMSVKPDVFL